MQVQPLCFSKETNRHTSCNATNLYVKCSLYAQNVCKMFPLCTQDLRDLPRNSAVRKINELVKRARLAKVRGKSGFAILLLSSSVY